MSEKRKMLESCTDDELRDELKRRQKERMKNAAREVMYVEFEATVSGVDNLGRNFLGTEFKRPFILWTYKVEDCSLDLAAGYPDNEYKLKTGLFNKGNAPEKGDRVKLRYRRTKGRFESVDLARARIVGVVKGNAEEVRVGKEGRS